MAAIQSAILLKLRQYLFLICDDRVQRALVLQNGHLVLSDRILIGLNGILVRQNRLLILQDSFLVGEHVVFGHFPISFFNIV
jgi:hypothetical protein